MKKELSEVVEYLESLSSPDLVNAWNQMCSEKNPDNEIYGNDEEFFETFFNGKVVEAVMACHYGDFNYSHDWVQFNGYGNLDSTDSPESLMDFSELAQFIIEHESDFDVEFEEEEEE